MALPARLTLNEFWYALDGGTTVLQASDEVGRTHHIMLVQHSRPEASPSLKAIPGRFYFDGELVAIRSQMEARILSLLQAAKIEYTGALLEHGERMQPSSHLFGGAEIHQVLSGEPQQTLRMLRENVVGFVASEEYVRFAERVEQAADPTRYNVWAAWEPASRNHLAVRLGHILGIGWQSARELLERGTPLAEHLSALEVSDLATRYAAEGVAVRVEPAFRWRLK